VSIAQRERRFQFLAARLDIAAQQRLRVRPATKRLIAYSSAASRLLVQPPNRDPLPYCTVTGWVPSGTVMKPGIDTEIVLLPGLRGSSPTPPVATENGV
jgi:hypothetical protein